MEQQNARRNCAEIGKLATMRHKDNRETRRNLGNHCRDQCHFHRAQILGISGLTVLSMPQCLHDRVHDEIFQLRLLPSNYESGLADFHQELTREL
jgi:hypothetical protein